MDAINSLIIQNISLDLYSVIMGLYEIEREALSDEGTYSIG
jgi:hypothetical protein